MSRTVTLQGGDGTTAELTPGACRLSKFIQGNIDEAGPDEDILVPAPCLSDSMVAAVAAVLEAVAARPDLLEWGRFLVASRQRNVHAWLAGTRESVALSADFGGAVDNVLATEIDGRDPLGELVVCLDYLDADIPIALLLATGEARRRRRAWTGQARFIDRALRRSLYDAWKPGRSAPARASARFATIAPAADPLFAVGCPLLGVHIDLSVWRSYPPWCEPPPEQSDEMTGKEFDAVKNAISLHPNRVVYLSVCGGTERTFPRIKSLWQAFGCPVRIHASLLPLPSDELSDNHWINNALAVLADALSFPFPSETSGEFTVFCPGVPPAPLLRELFGLTTVWTTASRPGRELKAGASLTVFLDIAGLRRAPAAHRAEIEDARQPLSGLNFVVRPAVVVGDDGTAPQLMRDIWAGDEVVAVYCRMGWGEVPVGTVRPKKSDV